MVVASGVSTGFLFPLPVVVGLVLLHRAHVYLLGGCALTRLEKRLGALPMDQDFLQSAVVRLLRKPITRAQSHILDYVIVPFTVMVAAVRWQLGM